MWFKFLKFQRDTSVHILTVFRHIQCVKSEMKDKGSTERNTTTLMQLKREVRDNRADLYEGISLYIVHRLLKFKELTKMQIKAPRKCKMCS